MHTWKSHAAAAVAVLSHTILHINHGFALEDRELSLCANTCAVSHAMYVDKTVSAIFSYQQQPHAALCVCFSQKGFGY